MGLKNKKILITAGPTWVPIDKVRVISNIATGQTGMLLATELKKKGTKVTLILGPTGENAFKEKGIRILNFKFYYELLNIIKQELKRQKYDIIIHSAAVSDYKPLTYFKNKIKSGIEKLKLILVPLPKIINIIKKISPDIFLVGFKFEPNAGKIKLIKSAELLLKNAKADMVVASTLDRQRYRAYIIEKNLNGSGPFLKRIYLTKALVAKLESI